MLGVGGREKITIDLANSLCCKGHDVRFVTLSFDQNQQAPLLHNGIKLYALPSAYKSLNGPAAIFFWIKCLPILVQILRAEKPAIVHTHVFFQRLYFTAVAIKRSGIATRHFHTIHTSGLFYKEKGVINKARLAVEQRAIALNKAFIIAIADEVYQNAIKYFSKQASGIKLIYNGVDEKQFDYRLKGRVAKSVFGLQEENIVVTYLARITKGKDHLTLLKAWKQVTIQHPGARLCLAGDGELKTQMQAFCKEEKIEDSVLFLGTVKNVPTLLAVTDIGVFTSLFEGFSIAVLEQMMMKIPNITTNISAFNQFIKNNENGFLFQLGDASTLAVLIGELANNRELRTRIGEAAYRAAQGFSLDKMINNHEAAYECA